MLPAIAVFFHRRGKPVVVRAVDSTRSYQSTIPEAPVLAEERARLERVQEAFARNVVRQTILSAKQFASGEYVGLDVLAKDLGITK